MSRLPAKNAKQLAINVSQMEHNVLMQNRVLNTLPKSNVHRMPALREGISANGRIIYAETKIARKPFPP